MEMKDKAGHWLDLHMPKHVWPDSYNDNRLGKRLNAADTDLNRQNPLPPYTQHLQTR